MLGDQSSELCETRWPGVAPQSSTGQTGLGLYLVGSVKKGEMMREVTFGEETLSILSGEAGAGNDRA